MKDPAIEQLNHRYKPYMSKIQVKRCEMSEERGVFATENIRKGEVVLRMPLAECMVGDHKQLATKLTLMEESTVYTRALPASTSNFPAQYNEHTLQSMGDSAMVELSKNRRIALLEDKPKNLLDQPWLHYRLLVGSRGFSTKDKEHVVLCPVGDMMNHSNEHNIDWKVEKMKCDECLDGIEETETNYRQAADIIDICPPLVCDDPVERSCIVFRALSHIDKGKQLFDSYGTKTNYEALLFYGMVLLNNTQHDITYPILEVPVALRKNLNYQYFKDEFEYELCGAYSRGTLEIFSMLRFLVCANLDSSKCPKSLQGIYLQPISIDNELAVVTVLLDHLNAKMNKRPISPPKHQIVCSFLRTERKIYSHWINTLTESQQILGHLSKKNKKKAGKSYKKATKTDYMINVVNSFM